MGIQRRSRKRGLGKEKERIGLGYIVDTCIAVAGGYADSANILNHREDNVWAIQVKYES